MTTTEEKFTEFTNSKTIEEKVQKLINGETAIVTDEHKKEVQERLREIKKNCTIVLSQLKNGL